MDITVLYFPSATRGSVVKRKDSTYFLFLLGCVGNSGRPGLLDLTAGNRGGEEGASVGGVGRDKGREESDNTKTSSKYTTIKTSRKGRKA